jgi:hypothetical protein
MDSYSRTVWVVGPAAESSLDMLERCLRQAHFVQYADPSVPSQQGAGKVAVHCTERAGGVAHSGESCPGSMAEFGSEYSIEAGYTVQFEEAGKCSWAQAQAQNTGTR